MKLKFIYLALTLLAAQSFASDIPADILERHNKECPDFSDPERGQYMARQVIELPQSQYSTSKSILYVLGCEMYAYNSMGKAYIGNKYGFTQVALPEVAEDGTLTATTDLMGVDADKDTFEISTWYKGRGMGDCGMSATYKYDKDSGSFYLFQEYLKAHCDGEPTDWPMVYPKKSE